jgi:hypothetical protein
MRRIVILLIILCLVISCTSNNSKFPDIEYAAFSAKHLNMDTIPTLLTRYYAHINQNQTCSLAVLQSPNSAHFGYYLIKKSNTEYLKILSIIYDSAKNLTHDVDFRNGPALYDGMTIVAEIDNQKGKVKLKFWEGEKQSYAYYKLLEFLESSYENNSLIEIKDSSKIYRKMQIFITKEFPPSNNYKTIPLK